MGANITGYIPLILSFFAIIVSIATLYFSQLRKGRLHLALANRILITTTNFKPSFEITVSMLNSGVMPIIINHINLIAKLKGQKVILFKIPVAEFTEDKLLMLEGRLEVKHNEERVLVKPIILNGKDKSIITFCFAEAGMKYKFVENEQYMFTLEFITNNNIKRKKNVDFTISFDKSDTEDFYSEESIKKQIDHNRFVGQYKLINNWSEGIVVPTTIQN
jgi:hypothetical protein